MREWGNCTAISVCEFATTCISAFTARLAGLPPVIVRACSQSLCGHLSLSHGVCALFACPWAAIHVLVVSVCVYSCLCVYVEDGSMCVEAQVLACMRTSCTRACEHEQMGLGGWLGVAKYFGFHHLPAGDDPNAGQYSFTSAHTNDPQPLPCCRHLSTHMLTHVHNLTNTHNGIC